MILKKLQIRNFRRNKRLDVVLGRVTTFRGPSGSGKSSLIGALKWAIMNQPSGTSFIRWGHKRVAVRLIIGAHKIARIRCAEINQYQCDGQGFEAFGKGGVPTKISNILNMGPLNFQRQHAGPFWFRERASEVSRQLNAVVNLDLIDRTIAHINQEERKTKIRLQDVQERVEGALEEKVRLGYVRALERRLGALNDAIRSRDKGRKRIQRLSELMEQAKECQKKISRPIPNIKPLLTLEKKYRAGQRQYERLAALFGKAEEYEEAIIQMQGELQRKEQRLKKLMGKRCPLCGNPIK